MHTPGERKQLMPTKLDFVKRAFSHMLILITCGLISAKAVERPKLVIYLSIDQMKAEYLEWYKAEFTAIS